MHTSLAPCSFDLFGWDRRLLPLPPAKMLACLVGMAGLTISTALASGTGSMTAKFLNIRKQSPSATVGNVSGGITWGTPNTGSFPSTLTFTPTSNPFAAPVPGTQNLYDLGTVTYTNGTQVSNSGITGFTLQLDPTAKTLTPASIPVTANNTSNTSVPKDSADFVRLDLVPVFSSMAFQDFHVLEGETAHADLLGTLKGDPALEVVGFENASPGGFLDNAPNIPVPEGNPAWLLAAATIPAAGLLLRRRARSKTA